MTPLLLLPGSPEAATVEDRAIAEKGYYLHPSPRERGDLMPPSSLLLFSPLHPVPTPPRATTPPAESRRAEPDREDLRQDGPRQGELVGASAVVPGKQAAAATRGG